VYIAGRMRILVLSLVLVGVAGCTCGSDSTQGAQIPREVLERPRGTAKRKYDSQGDLMESANRLKGLPMPEGLGESKEFQGSHMFRTHLPIDRLVRYFGQRLETTTVETRGKGAIYRKALFKKATPEFANYRYDVSILPAMNFTLVSVIVAPPPTGIEPDVKDLARQYQEILDRAQ